MGNEAILKGRVINKHDIEANWIKAKGFIPKAGEPIVYDAELDSQGNILELPEGRAKPYTHARIKIGDGVTEVNDLIFSDYSSTNIESYNSFVQPVLIDIENNISENITCGENTAAFGLNTTAGSMGYHITYANKQKSDYGYAYTVQLNDGENIPEILLNQKCSIYLEDNWDNIATVNYIDGNIIYLDILCVPNKTEILYDGSYIKFDTYPEVGNIGVAEGAFAQGYGTKALGIASHAEGVNTTANGKYAHTEGRATYANYAAHAEGQASKALAWGAHAEGTFTEASGRAAHAEGNYTKALSDATHAEGFYSVAEANYSHAEGYKTYAKKFYSHAQNNATLALSTNSHAEGKETAAGAFGFNITGRSDGATSYILQANDIIINLKAADVKEASSQLQDKYSLLIGQKCRVFIGDTYIESIVQNISIYNDTEWKNKKFRVKIDPEDYISTAIVSNSFITFLPASSVSDTVRNEIRSIGFEFGQNSHAQGMYTQAFGDSSAANGIGTIALGEAQTAIGKYNKVISDALFIVGNGTSDTDRSTAFTINTDGTADFLSTVRINGEDVATIKSIDIAEFDTTRIYHNGVKLSTILDDYVTNIDASILDFDTDEIIFTTSELGEATLGDMILG